MVRRMTMMKSFLKSDNRLLQLARSGYRLPAKLHPILDKTYPIIALVLAVIFLVTAQLSGAILGLGIFVPWSLFTTGEMPSIESLLEPETGLGMALSLMFTFGPIFLVLWVWLFLFEKRHLWTVGLERRHALKKYRRGLLVGLGMFTAAVGISAAMGYIAFESGDPQKQGWSALGGVVIVFLGWVVQGAGEEVITRGWLLPVIGSRYNAPTGIILSSLLFAMFHLLNPNLGLIAMLNLFLFGVFAALYALYEGGLWGVFSIHTVWNWAQGNLFGFSVSGTEAGGTLFNLMEVGPDSITGGAFGPEGGLAVTVVLLAGCVILWIAGQRQQPAGASAAQL